jgi:glutamine synthetase type III
MKRLKFQATERFEPLPASDRQMAARVARILLKAMQQDMMKSVCRELPLCCWLHEGCPCIVCVNHCGSHANWNSGASFHLEKASESDPAALSRKL